MTTPSGSTGAPTVDLRYVAPGGVVGTSPLPSFESIDLSPVSSAPGVVNFDYPGGGVNAHLLEIGTEIVPRIDGTEIDDCRAIIDSVDDARVSERGSNTVASYKAVTMLGILKRAKVYPQDWPDSTQPPHHDFNSATAGEIVSVLMVAAQARGCFPFFTFDSFTATHDTAGAEWDTIISIQFDAGVGYEQVLESLVDNQMCEARVVGHDLRLFNPGTMSTDRTVVDPPLVFRAGRDMTDAPRSVDATEVMTSLLTAGDNGVYYETTDPTAVARYGRREGYKSQANMADQSSLAVYSEAVLELGKHPKMEQTHGVTFSASGNPVPGLAFDVGDWVYSDTTGTLERLRLRQWSLSVGSDGEVSGTVVLNDLIAERLARLTKRVDGIVGGSTLTGGSSAREVEDLRDDVPPGVPERPVLTSEAASDFHGNVFAYVSASWPEVTVNADGTITTDLDRYLVQWRYPNRFGPGSEWTLVETRTTGITFSASPGETVEVRVAAVDYWNNVSGWSESATVVTETDAEPPPTPSTPLVTAYLGTVRIGWDGLGAAGEFMPGDFAFAKVHLSTVTGFQPTGDTLVDRLLGASVTNVTDLAYDVPVYIRLVAVDNVGNESPPSAQASATPRPVVGTDVDGDAIGLDHIQFTDATNKVPDGSFELATRRDDLLSAADSPAWGFQSNGYHGAWALRANGYEDPGLVRTLWLTPYIPTLAGHKLYVRLAGMGIAGSNGTPELTLEGRTVDGTTIPFGQLTWSGTGDGVWRIHDHQTDVPDSTIEFRVAAVLDADCNIGEWYWDQVEVRDVVESIIIADAAITRAKIADLAVGDAKIADLAVGKLTGGTLTADVVIGSHIRAVDSGGMTTIDLDGTTGRALVTGQLRSARDGMRIVYNADPAQPEIDFHSDVSTQEQASKIYVGISSVNTDAPSVVMVGPDPDVDNVVFGVSANDGSVNLARFVNEATDPDFGDVFEELTVNVGNVNATIYAGDGQTLESGWTLDRDFFYVETRLDIGGWEGRLRAGHTGSYVVCFNPGLGAFNGVVANPDGVLDARAQSGDGLWVSVEDGSSRTRVLASSYDVAPSSRSDKTNIRPLPFSAVQAVRTAPVTVWEPRVGDGRSFIGPMADDLPALLSVAVTSPTSGGLSSPTSVGVSPPTGDTRAVPLGSLAGFVLAALQELDVELDAVRSALNLPTPTRNLT